MILDHLNNHEKYRCLHPAFGAAFDYLLHTDPARIEPGRYELDGTRLYAMVAHDAGKGRERARLEAHRQYIDIQWVASGTDEMGWRALGECSRSDTVYDDAKDIRFYRDEPTLWLPVPAGHFVIFFPDDAHAPLAGSGAVVKAVVKVLGG